MYAANDKVHVHLGISLRRLGIDQETALAWGFSYDPDSRLVARVSFTDEYLDALHVRATRCDARTSLIVSLGQ